MKRQEAIEVLKSTSNCVYMVQKSADFRHQHYETSGAESVYGMLQSPSMYAYHELISGDKPCRLYVDIDKTEDITSILAAVGRCIHEKLGVEPPSPVVFSAGPSSHHAAWDVWLSTPSDVKALLTGLGLDEQVYPNSGVCKTLRLPLSYKVAEGGELVRKLDHAEPTYENFLGCTAGWGYVGQKLHTVEKQDEGLFSESGVKRQRIAGFPEPLELYLKEVYIGKTERCATRFDKCVTQVIRESICPFKCAIHARKQAQVAVLSFATLNLKCFDEECKGLEYQLVKKEVNDRWCDKTFYPSSVDVQRDRLKWAMRRQGRVWFSASELFLPELVSAPDMVTRGDGVIEEEEVALTWAANQMEKGVGREEPAVIWDLNVDTFGCLTEVFYRGEYEWRLSKEEWTTFCTKEKVENGLGNYKNKRLPILVLRDTRLKRPYAVWDFIRDRPEQHLRIDRDEKGQELGWTLNMEGEGESFKEGDWACLDYLGDGWPKCYIVMVVHRWVPRQYLEKARLVKGKNVILGFVIL